MANLSRVISSAPTVAVIVGLAAVLVAVAPARAHPTPRPASAEAPSAPPGEGWWCWSADVVGGGTRTGCARDQGSCTAQADDARLADVLTERLAAVGTCRHQPQAVVVAYRERPDRPVRHAAYRTAAECRREQQALRQRPDVQALSACAQVGRVGPAALPEVFAPERLGAVAAVPIDGITKADITRAIAGASGQVEACATGRRGLVVVAVRVAPSGAIISASPTRTFDDEVGACVVAAVQGLAFRATKDGGSFRYPFRL